MGCSAPNVTCSALSANASATTVEFDECSICTDNVLHADAAMRCLGNGGKNHYFHAACLAAWIRQCSQDGNGPTCPQCRGPVQVRARRLEDFLRDEGGKLKAEDAEALQSFHDSAEASSDDLGWSNIKPHLWKVGAGLALIGLGAALVAGISAA